MSNTLVVNQKDIDTINKNEFARVLKNSKSLAKKLDKEYIKVSNKQIMKQRLAQLYVCGYYSIDQIASILFVSKNTVKRLLKDEEVLNMVLNYQDEEKTLIDTRIKSLRLKATDTMQELLDSDDDAIRIQVAKDILDRTGHKAKDEKDINVNISYEQQLNELINGVEFSVDADYVEDTNNE